MPSQPTPATDQPPPELPSMPDVSDTLSRYLRTFSLWCRNGFRDKLSASQSLPSILLQTDTTPPAVYKVSVNADPNLTLTPIALGSGTEGTPVIAGSNTFLPLTGGSLSGSLNVNGAVIDKVAFYADQSTAGDNCHFVMRDTVGNWMGYLYWEHTNQNVICANPVGGNSTNIASDGWFRVSSPMSVHANLLNIYYYGITYGSASYGSSNTFAFGWNIWGGLANVSVSNGGAAYPLASASDARMKENVAPSKLDCLAMVQKLPLKQFRWKGHTDPWQLKEARAAPDARIEPVGMVAQEIHKIFPHGVVQGDDHEDHLGKVWTLDQNAMISLLVGAVQQLSARVAELEGK